MRDAQRVLLEPSGQLVVQLRADRRPASRGDLRQLQVRLDRIEDLLTRTYPEDDESSRGSGSTDTGNPPGSGATGGGGVPEPS